MYRYKKILAEAFLLFNLIFVSLVTLAHFTPGCNQMLRPAYGSPFCLVGIPVLRETLLVSQEIFLFFFISSIITFGLPVLLYGIIWVFSYRTLRCRFLVYVLLPILIPIIAYLLYVVSSINWDYIKYRVGIDSENYEEYYKIDNPDIVVDKKVCNQTSVYGFTYYINEDVKKVCYGGYRLSADAETFVPLISVSSSTEQALVPKGTNKHSYIFAFDKNNFYMNGKIIYRVSEGNYKVEQMPTIEKPGKLLINEMRYVVSMKDTFWATLE